MYKARLVRGLALAAVLSLGIAACAQDAEQQTQDNNNGDGQEQQAELEADPAPEVPQDVVMAAGDGKAKCAKDTSIAYIGTIAGEAAALGVNILNGAKTAVEEHNAANPDCQVKLKEFDSEGIPDKAPGVTTQAINDESILGIIGLAFSGESDAVGPLLDKSGMVALSASATNPELAQNDWSHFYRGLGNDAVQGPAVSRFIQELKAEKVCVVQDDSAYGIGLADIVKKDLGDRVVCEPEVKTKQKEFGAVTGEITSADPDTVFYSGYYPEAGPFVQQLKNSGFTGNVVTPDGVRDDGFIQGAGEQAEGVYMTCPCLPSDGFSDFTTAYEEASGGKAPGTYSPEAYDAATILLQGIDSGIDNREDLREYVKNYKGQGLTKYFEFDENGEVKETPVWTYVVEDGQIVHFKDVSK